MWLSSAREPRALVRGAWSGWAPMCRDGGAGQWGQDAHVGHGAFGPARPWALRWSVREAGREGTRRGVAALEQWDSYGEGLWL